MTLDKPTRLKTHKRCMFSDSLWQIVFDPNSPEAAEQIWMAIYQKIQDVVKQHADETRTTRWSMYVTDPASVRGHTHEEQSRLLRTKELVTLSRSEIADLRAVVQYEIGLALDLTELRVSSLKTIDALEALRRDNEREISRLEAIVSLSLAPGQNLECILRHYLRSTFATEINHIMARACEVVVEGRLFD